MSQNLDGIASSIEGEISSLDSTARSIAQASQARYRASMEPGQTLPDFGEFTAADEDAKQGMRDAEGAAYQEIVGIIDRALAADRKDMSAPASADDVATVQLALSRDRIDAEELAALHERYGSNYQLGTAIRERAAKQGVFLEGAPLKLDRDEGLRRAARIIGRHSYGRGGTPSFIDSPANVATNIVEGLAHIDFLGRVY